MTAEPLWKPRTEPESRRPVFVAALVIIAGQAWVARSLRLSRLSGGSVLIPAALLLWALG